MGANSVEECHFLVESFVAQCIRLEDRVKHQPAVMRFIVDDVSGRC
jgi:hypothetical protein